MSYLFCSLYYLADLYCIVQLLQSIWNPKEDAVLQNLVEMLVRQIISLAYCK